MYNLPTCIGSICGQLKRTVGKTMKAQKLTSTRRIRAKSKGRTLPGRRSPRLEARRLPIGAEVVPSSGAGGVHFRVWAPRAEWVGVELSSHLNFSGDTPQVAELQREENGYFSTRVADARAGMFYRFRLRREPGNGSDAL